MITEKELDDYLISQSWTRNDLTDEQLSSLRHDMEWVKNGGDILDGFLFFEDDLQLLKMQRLHSSLFVKPVEWDKLRSMIARCQWTYAKTMPFAPHEYIVKDKCPLTSEEFEYFVSMQREHGVKERWGKYNHPYLYIDDYKYWSMGAPMEETTVINRAKVCAVNEAHELYEGIEKVKEEQNMEQHQYIDEYVQKQLGLKDDDKGYSFNLLSGRLEELSACASHLERIRRNYSHEIMKGWSEQIAEDFPECKIVENLGPANIVYTGITVPYKDISEAMTVRIQIAYKSLYYGLTYMPETKDLRNEMQEAMSFINETGDFIKGSDWLYYNYVSWGDGYDKLRKLIERMKES